MSQIFITNGQKGEALTHIRYRNILSNSHKKSLEDNSETFDFTTHADKSFSQYIEGMNRVIIPGEDENFLEFIIYEIQEDKVKKELEVYSYASYAELITARSIEPHTTEALSAEAHGNRALLNTEWKMGNVEFKGVRTITFEDYTNPYAYLRKVASEFDLELDFRVEHENGNIIGRYVDLVEKVGQWRGRRVEFGKDLIGLRRIENTDNIVTALRVIGPVREDGSRLEVIVEDLEALARWGRNGKHIIKEYEPQFDDPENATIARLRELGEQELAKRVNAIVSYEGTIADLENVPGMENKKIRFGDTIQIKVTSYEPALYLDARIFFQDRDIKEQAEKIVYLGDFIEYTEEEVHSIWKELQQQIASKIGRLELEEITYTKPEIDEKDERGNQAADKIETDVGWVTPIESTTGAQEKANQAKDDANDYTDGIKQQIDTELLEKTDYEYVDGKLALKADSEVVQAINNTVDGLEQTTSNLLQSVADNADALEVQGGRITTVEADLDEVEGQLSLALTDLSTLAGTVSQQGTQISANTEAIGLKASQSDLDTLSGDVSSISGQLTVMAGEIEAKADRQALETLEGNVTTISDDLASLSVAYDGITADISSLETTTDGLTTDITNLNTEIQAVAGEVSSKVSAEYVTGAIADIEIGGRNLLQGTKDWSQGKKAGSITDDKYKELSILSYDNTNGTNTVDVAQWSSAVDVEPNTEYTLSFYAKGSGEFISYFYPNNVASGYSSEGKTTNGSDGNIRHTLTTDWKKYSITWETLSTASGLKSVLPMRLISGAIGYICGVMFEKGNKATDWSPAPEDVQAEIDSVYSYASSEISQLSGRIDLKADSTVIEGIESRVTSAELSIDGLEGQISSKVEANDVRSIFLQEAGSFTFSANQINFDGHVFGQNATFEGRIEGAEIVSSTFNQSGSKGSITLDQEGLKIRDASNSLRMILSTTNGSYQSFSPSSIIFEPNDNFYELVAGTGLSGLGDGFFGFKNSAPNRTLNMLNEGNGSSIQFFSPQVNIGGRLVIGGGLVGQGKVARLEFNTNRSSVSSILWNASGSVDYGMVFNVDGSNVARLESDGTMSVNRFKPFNTQSFYVMAQREVRVTDERGYNDGNTNYIPIRARSFEPPQSLRELKHNIDVFDKDTLDVFRNSNAYLFNYNFESVGDKRTLGIMLDEVPVEIHSKSGTSVDLYSMAGYLWKGMKDVISITDQHADDINLLKMENQYLRGKIEDLERKIA